MNYPIAATGAYGAYSGDHLASIQKLANGFVVSYTKAIKVQVKQKGMAEYFNPDMQEMIKLGLNKMREGDMWKETADDLAAKMETKAVEHRWHTQQVSMSCKDEAELIAVIRDAVVAYSQISQLALDGEFGTM